METIAPRQDPLRVTAERAELLLKTTEPDWHRFFQAWMAFNALYNIMDGRTERRRVMQVIRKFLDPVRADTLIEAVSDPIAYFTQLPPGDTRKGSYDPDFRQQSTADMRVVNDETADPVERMAHLMAVVYQVRCSLLHGRKNPRRQRDLELVAASRSVLEALLPALIGRLRER